jgi:hypothetical protein
MNAAVALIESRSGARTVDLTQFRTHLERLVPLPAGFGWDEEPIELPREDAALATLGLYAAQLADTQTLASMEQSGRAGLLLFDHDEFEQVLSDVSSSDTKPSEYWLEAKSMEDGRWVVYPQDDSPEIRLAMWLPVMSGADGIRLVALDTGVNVSSGDVQAPSARISECDHGLSGSGTTRRQACFGGSCTGTCQEGWKYIQQEFVLVSCPCT